MNRYEYSQQVRGHNNEYADIDSKFEDLSMTLKELSAEKSTWVLTYPKAIF